MKRDKVLRGINELTQETLCALVHYEPETGMWTRLVTTRNAKAGTETQGSMRTDGYLAISIAGRQYLCHRLAIFYMTGEWPPEHTDHRYGDRSDNRFEKIRKATASQNQYNRRRLDKRNSSGVRGVTWSKIRKKWVAQIRIMGKTVNLGGFVDIRDAERVRKRAEQQHFGEFMP
jgi:hypothetical protein